MNAIIKTFNTSEIGVPKLSIHMNVMPLLLVLSNSDARIPLKRKLVSWRGVGDAINIQQQTSTQGQATNRPPISVINISLPNQTHQDNVN